MSLKKKYRWIFFPYMSQKWQFAAMKTNTYIFTSYPITFRETEQLIDNHIWKSFKEAVIIKNEENYAS